MTDYFRQCIILITTMYVPIFTSQCPNVDHMYINKLCFQEEQKITNKLINTE